MRRLLWLLLLAPTLASADELVFVWDPAPNATHYDVGRSTDFSPYTGAGQWSVIATVQAAACAGTPVECSYTDANAPAGGAMYRITAKNSAGSLTIIKKGVWYCGTGCTESPLPQKLQRLGVSP